MAELIDRCQALVDEHFDSEEKSPAELRQLLPNPVVNMDGITIKEAGSVLPDSVVARIYELSYEFMSYPEDLAKLGLEYYHSHLLEIEKLFNDEEEAARMKRETRIAN